MRGPRVSISGKNHPFYGKHHSQATKDKLHAIRIGIKLSEECKAKMSQHKQGWKNNQACLVYCIELNMMFGTRNDGAKYVGISNTLLSYHLNNKRLSAGKHPETGDPLHWKYVYDKMTKTGDIIQGAITLGYITEEQVKEYFNNLQQKEIE